MKSITANGHNLKTRSIAAHFAQCISKDHCRQYPERLLMSTVKDQTFVCVGGMHLSSRAAASSFYDLALEKCQSTSP